MFSLIDFTEEDPESIKEAIFIVVGEDVISRKLDFKVVSTKTSHKRWITMIIYDLHDAL